MRTFIAIELSKEVKDDLAKLQHELNKADADVKWVKPENIHLTLKFLGEVGEDKIEDMKKVLDGISGKNKPFELSLFKLGAFPSINSPRVVWVGIDKGCGESEQIAKSIEDELEKLDFPKEERPFNAHLTLGRVRSGKNKAMLKERLSATEVRPKSCRINDITIFQSILTPKGPIYSPLHAAKLTPLDN